MNLDLPSLEARMQTQWQEQQTFKASLDPSRPVWRLLEGPPTMNGHPGVHHVEPRAFKDLYGRYHTMRGRYVPRQAGWDCHGLPVELSVAAAHGMSTQELVAELGQERFEELCRESVEAHQRTFEELTRRMGYWLDLENSYRTMDPAYMENVWRFLKQTLEEGRLYEDTRVTPWCTSCQTALSSHEVAQGYKQTTDRTVTVALESGGVYLLAWTTTPWTLPENLLVGVHPDLQYVEVQTARGVVVVSAAHQRRDPRLRDGTVLRHLPGSELVGRSYTPPFGERRADAHRVVAAEFVTEDVGTGLVHLAPAYGRDDQDVARREGLSYHVQLGPEGRYLAGTFEGEAYLEVAQKVPALLLEKLWEEGEVTHEYPHCWRCHTRLVHLARPCWYLATTKVAERMLAENEETSWQPRTAGERRYGAWLRENVDWAVSRERYWGTPLPLWRCEEGHVQAVGSREELGKLTGKDCTDLDLHRSSVDPLLLACHCGKEARRVPEVVDCWLDAGLAPSTWGEAPPPADLVAEGVDQTRGWFYALQAVAHLSHGRRAYRNVLALGHVVDADGQKMSKHKGNVLDPFELFDEHGADAVRWQLLTDGSPWGPRRLSGQSVRTAAGELAQLWACAQYLPGGVEKAGESTHPLDRWLQHRTNETVAAVTAALDAYDPQRAGAALKELLSDLSLRYLKASRTRLPQDPAGQKALRESLSVLARLTAPFVPFLAEALHTHLGHGGSVHHAPWPEPGPGEDGGAADMVEEVWALLEDGRKQRTRRGVRQRQVLARADVRTSRELPEALLTVLREGLNVQEVQLSRPLWQVKPNWRMLGRRYGKQAPEVAKLLPATSEQTGEVTVVLDGTVHHLAGEVQHTPLAPLELEWELTAELEEAGRLADLLREVVEARRSAGHRAEEQVEVWFPDPEKAALANRHEEVLRGRNTLLGTRGALSVE